MDEDDDLLRGRIITKNTTVDRQDEENRQVWQRLMFLEAAISGLETRTLGKQRAANASITKLETDVFVLERKLAVRKVWIWFATVTAVLAATGNTVTWILLGNQ